MVSLNSAVQAGEGLAGLLVMAPDCDVDQVTAAWRHLEECALDEEGGDDLRAALDVAHILAGLHLDTDSLCAALLHAPVARGTLPLDAVRKSFGGRIATLVDGVVRMDTIRDYAVAEGDAEAHARHTESLRKMLMAMVDDVRVVLVKLAARLQAMRGLRDRPEEERRHVAQETRDIFAPLANRLGIWQVKWELEDLAFRYLEPETYQALAKSLAERRVDRERYLDAVTATLQGELQTQGLVALYPSRAPRCRVTPAIASRRGDNVGAGAAEVKYRITRGPGVEDKTVHRVEIALFDPGGDDVEDRSALFPAIQVVDNGDNGHGPVCFQPPVQRDE